jgi:hypothetical protein
MHTFQIVTTDGRDLGPMALGRPDWPWEARSSTATNLRIKDPANGANADGRRPTSACPPPRCVAGTPGVKRRRGFNRTRRASPPGFFDTRAGVTSHGQSGYAAKRRREAAPLSRT